MQWVLLALVPILIMLLVNYSAAQSNTEQTVEKPCGFHRCNYPVVYDQNLTAKLLYQMDFKFEPNELSPTTTMTFVGKDILILNKNNGTIYEIKNGTVLDRPLLDVNVANKRERGMLGIANFNDNSSLQNIFLYFTEAKQKDGTDVCNVSYYCEPSTNPLGNRLYKYQLVNNTLVNPKLLLDLPASPAPTHNGGVIKIGPDKNLYVVIGDLEGYYNKSSSTMVQNFKNGTNPDGRAGILRIAQDGKVVENGILGNKFPLSLYYAYGIRNSFGIDFDPITGNLWDTENGPEYGDEVNFVNPGFNSGWIAVQGIWKPNESNDPNSDFVAGDMLLHPTNLVDFGGKGTYSPPEFISKDAIGLTAIKFLNSDKLGKKYENDLFVASVSLGTIFHFKLNKERTSLNLEGPLSDKIADNLQETQNVTFAKGFGGITDLKVGPDGYLYVLSKYKNKGSIFVIEPKLN